MSGELLGSRSLIYFEWCFDASNESNSIKLEILLRLRDSQLGYDLTRSEEHRALVEI